MACKMVYGSFKGWTAKAWISRNWARVTGCRVISEICRNIKASPWIGKSNQGTAGKEYFLLHSIPQHLCRSYIAFAFSSTGIVEELLDSSRLINSN